MKWIIPPHAVQQSATKGANQEREKSSDYGKMLQMPLLGLVVGRHSQNSSVDVKMEDGRLLQWVPVRPPYWTGLQAQANPSNPTGGRDLPPLYSEVVVLFISGSIDRPLVLCSAPNQWETWQESTLGVTGKENQKITYLEQGWTFEFDSDTGDMTLASDPSDKNQIKVAFSKSNQLVSIAYGTQEITMDGTKFHIAAGTNSLGAMIDNLISIISGLSTLNCVNGSPTTLDVATQTKLANWQTSFDGLVG